MRDRSLFQNTVTEIENVPLAAKACQHIIHCLIQCFSTGDEDRWIEISLRNKLIPELHSSFGSIQNSNRAQ